MIILAAIGKVQTSFSLKPSISDDRNLDSLKNIPLLAKIAQNSPVLLEERISGFASSKKTGFKPPILNSIHSSAKEARDDKLAKKEKKEKRKKQKSKDEDSEENQESKEQRRARREKRRAEKRARKESDQMNLESTENGENSSSSNFSVFSDSKRQKMHGEAMETEEPENLPDGATACSLTFDDKTKIVVQNIKKITLTSGDGAKSFQNLRIGQKVVSIHPKKNSLVSCIVGWTPNLQKRVSDSSSDNCKPFIVSLKKLNIEEIENIKSKIVKK